MQEAFRFLKVQKPFKIQQISIPAIATYKIFCVISRGSHFILKQTKGFHLIPHGSLEAFEYNHSGLETTNCDNNSSIGVR